LTFKWRSLVLNSDADDYMGGGVCNGGCDKRHVFVLSTTSTYATMSKEKTPNANDIFVDGGCGDVQNADNYNTQSAARM